MATTTKKTSAKAVPKKTISKPRKVKAIQPKAEAAEPEISELGKKLLEIRARIEASGTPMLTPEEIQRERDEQRRELPEDF